MANKILLRRGLKANLPVLNVGELAFCTDTKELFIGTSSGNLRITTDILMTLASVSTNGLMSASDKAKLNGIAAGAQVNPGVATTTANGLMSAADKVKLNGLSGTSLSSGVATVLNNPASNIYPMQGQNVPNGTHTYVLCYNTLTTQWNIRPLVYNTGGPSYLASIKI